MKTNLNKVKFTEKGIDLELITKDVQLNDAHLNMLIGMTDGCVNECSLCSEELGEGTTCVEIVDGDNKTMYMHCKACSDEVFASIPEYIGKEVVVEKVEEVLTEQEEKEVKKTLKDMLTTCGEKAVSNIEKLTNTSNKEYVEGLLKTMKSCAIQVGIKSPMFKQILDKRNMLNEKKEEVQKDESKLRALTNTLKNIVKAVCKAMLNVLKATGKGALSICVLLAKIIANTTIEVVDTVKAIGGFYYDEVKATNLYKSAKEKKENKKKDTEVLKEMMDKIQL